jgi:hypothetical protein
LLPLWAKASLIVFCVVEIGLLVSLRTISGLAHVHAVQGISDTSAATLASACSETVAAIDDFWPAIDVLSVGRSVPIGAVRAWGQVPILVGVAHDACPAVATYASVVPAPERSIDNGAAADTLADVRRHATGSLPPTRSWPAHGRISRRSTAPPWQAIRAWRAPPDCWIRPMRSPRTSMTCCQP